jgi:hypothetical protein
MGVGGRVVQPQKAIVRKYFRRPNDLGGMSRCAPLCLGRPAARGYAEVALLHAAHDSIEAARRRLDR